MAIADKTLTCKECGATFVFTTGEQEFYKTKGLLNEPGRCPSCRSNRRRTRGGAEGGTTRQMYQVTCANCGTLTEVPFQPRQGRPVYCNDCYSSARTTR